ncbi:exocyst complex component sec10 domain-containing protein [Hirsutella rhossiliensis]|uniref:Exocyst complex component sec10 domain-containing protein n=1 Tax=Hirsutella rhossiliensis TaxID=111463 RepID=A0A9P8SDU1_9HYPO|nr:exocyst complex component sec10 domain-containing protein [Hirsutella rhossiliensis]KAH0957366.1 exocyst complex component sec10 domain-containing protein [Hirsutella rhossiliensis]
MERPSSGPKSLFPKGPSFTLETFSSKDFIVRDFVDSLAESAVPANRRSGPAQAAFDSKPLIRTFENALSQLASLGDELQEKESELLSQVRRAEIQHDQTLDTLGEKLDQSMSSFEALDVSLNSGGINVPDSNGRSDGGGNVAVQIGEKLEELDRKRRRAQDAIFLIQCWTEVSETGQLTSLDGIQRQGGADNKVRCAVIARQLMRISQQLDPASWGHANGQRNGAADGLNKAHNTREILEKFCETLEQDLLKQFNNSYRRQNFDDMSECAKVLYDFNGGASVIAVFVNQHQFFIDRDQLMSDEVTADGEMWEALADPDADPPGVEASLQSLVDEVKIVMQEESFIIRRAFPYYETVLVKFIQRVFQQSIQQRLEKVLDKAETISALAFLRSLHSSRSYISSLIEDLKTHGLTENPEPCSAQIAQALDQQMDELFVPYLVGTTYIEREKKSLEEMYSSLLFRFTIYHSRRKKMPTGFMASLAQQGTQLMASAKDAYLERLESSDLTPTQKRLMLRLGGLQDKENKNEIEVSEEDGALSVESAKRMLKWLAESVQRTLELGLRAETPKDMNVFLNLLLTSMGQVYIETALDAAHMQATMLENAKTEPDLSFLPDVRPAVTVSSIMERFIRIVLIRLAESNTTVRKSMEAQKKTALDSIERKTNTVLKVSLDVITNWTSKSLSGQKKQDFRPKDAELEFLQTPTCLSICTFLGRASKHAGNAIDGQNAEKFFSELALAIHQLLFDHFKKFQVNATGGLMVTQDIAKYVATMRDWPLSKDVAAAVEQLTEIGSLFIVGPEALREKSRTLAPGQTGARGKLSKADFRAFVQRRDDSGSVGIQGVLAGL